MMTKHRCLQCEKLFIPKQKRSRYCTLFCSKKAAYLRWRTKNLEYSRSHRRKYMAIKYADPVWKKKELRRKRNQTATARIAALTAYGGLSCSCDHHGKSCGPKPIEFLALDHIGGNGKIKGEGSTKLYRKLRRLGYPPGFRVLCHNCNSSLGIYGRCPLSITEKQNSR